MDLQQRLIMAAGILREVARTTRQADRALLESAADELAAKATELADAELADAEGPAPGQPLPALLLH
jgi:hypothetical protein